MFIPYQKPFLDINKFEFLKPNCVKIYCVNVVLYAIKPRDVRQSYNTWKIFQPEYKTQMLQSVTHVSRGTKRALKKSIFTDNSFFYIVSRCISHLER